MVLLFAEVESAHVELPVSAQLTVLPSVKVLSSNTGDELPVFTPFTTHWYCGLVPPLVTVAVKVTLWPGHIVSYGAVILILA